MYRNVVITSPIRDFQEANLGEIEYSTTWFKHIFKIGFQFVQIWQNRFKFKMNVWGSALGNVETCMDHISVIRDPNSDFQESILGGIS